MVVVDGVYMYEIDEEPKNECEALERLMRYQMALLETDEATTRSDIEQDLTRIPKAQHLDFLIDMGDVAEVVTCIRQEDNPDPRELQRLRDLVAMVERSYDV